jgi:hypothetical protein
MRTYVPKISFISTSDTEKERLLYQTAIIASGFYNRKGFVISPKILPNIPCVVAPEFYKHLTPSYWHDAARVGPVLPIQLTDLMKREVSKLKIVPVDTQIIDKLSENWATLSDKFWPAISQLFPREIKWMGEIEVRVTNYGPRFSFGLLSSQKFQKQIIHLRVDANLDDLATAIVSSFLWPQQADGSISFSQRTAIVDFVMSRFELKKIFPHHNLSNQNLNRLTASYHQQSLDYCRSLGIYFSADCQDIVNSHNQIFGTKELKIINKLLDNSGNLVTNDDLADTIWSSEESHSYWAINKMIQRLRPKLSQVGLKSESLVTVRGRGYKFLP